MKSYGIILLIAIALFLAAGYCYDRQMVGLTFAFAASGIVVLLLGPFVERDSKKW